MPRRKALVDENGEAVAQIEATFRPEGMSDWAWNTGRSLGNVALAQALEDVATGKRAAASASEAGALLEAATNLQARALKRHAKLRATIGQRLQQSLVEYRTTQALTDGMLRIQDDLAALVKASDNDYEDED